MSVSIEKATILPIFLPNVHVKGYTIAVGDSYYVSNGSRWALQSSLSIVVDRSLIGKGVEGDVLSNAWTIIYQSISGSIGMHNVTNSNTVLRMTANTSYEDGDLRFLKSVGGAQLSMLAEAGESYTINGGAQFDVADGETAILQYEELLDDWVLVGGSKLTDTGGFSGALNQLALFDGSNGVSGSGNFRTEGGDRLILGNGFVSRGVKLDIFHNAPFVFASQSTAGVIIGNDGGSLILELLGLNSSFPAGLAFDGSYDGGSLKTTSNITAYGTRSGGGYGGILNFRTSFGSVITDTMNIDSAGKVQINGLSGTGSRVVVSTADGSLANDNPDMLELNETLRLTPLGSEPTCNSGSKGLMYVNDGTNKLRFCDGTSWVDLN